MKNLNSNISKVNVAVTEIKPCYSGVTTYSHYKTWAEAVKEKR